MKALWFFVIGLIICMVGVLMFDDMGHRTPETDAPFAVFYVGVPVMLLGAVITGLVLVVRWARGLRKPARQEKFYNPACVVENWPTHHSGV